MAADTRGIFTLKAIRNNILNDEGVSLQDVFEGGLPFPAGYESGYTGGGYIGGQWSGVDKISYTTDTSTRIPGANLSSGRNVGTATGNLSAGYFAGGQNDSGEVTDVDKLTYSSDTTALLPTASFLSVTRRYFSSASNTTYGYFAGGVNSSLVERFTYSSETNTTLPGAALSVAKESTTGSGNLSNAYFAGFYPSYSTIDKISYGTETRSTLPATLSQARYYMGGVASSSGNQYFCGGQGGGTVVDRITVSDDTVARVPGADLPNGKTSYESTGNPSNGYILGGNYSTTEKLNFSSETTSVAPTAELTNQYFRNSSVSSRHYLYPLQFTPATNIEGETEGPNTGYFGGGRIPGYLSTMDKVTFSTDTTIAVPGALLSGIRGLLGATGSSTAGYFGGGYDSSNNRSTVDKVTYSSDTTAQVPGAALSAARRSIIATGNLTAGYFAGGEPGPYSTMDKITYSTDTTAAVPAAFLGVARNLFGGATSSPSSGYFRGGNPIIAPEAEQTLEKVNYSTDTISRLPDQPARKLAAGATGTSDVGYFGGGTAPGTESTVDKLIYSSETTVTLPSASNLSLARNVGAGTGNRTTGYFGGGSPGSVTTMDKLTFSSETTAVVPGARLSVGRNALAASSARANGLPQRPAATTTFNFSDASTAPNTGYFGGGRSSPSVFYSTMEKLNYSSDTTAVVPGASLSVARTLTHGTSNLTSGYFGAGYSAALAARLSTMDKTTYSSDTTAEVPGAALTGARAYVSATGNSTAGYFGGGSTPSLVSTMDKTTYSSDTTAAVPGAALSVAKYVVSATGNLTAGYFGGGLTPSLVSTMDKVTYSTDTTAAVPGAALSDALQEPGATGNLTAGYFGGGFISGPAFRSTMDKLTYSTDTTVRIPSAPLTAARYAVTATGNSGAGYFGGGSKTPGPITYSTMDKLTYSTDTTAEVPGARLSGNRARLGGASAKANAVASTTNIV